MSNAKENQLVEAESNQIAVTPSSGTAITPTGMLQIAVEQGADLDKLEKLMELQERWEKNEAKKAFNIAVAEFKKNPPVIIKDKDNLQYGSKYASKDSLVNTGNTALSEFGLNARWDIEQDDKNNVTVTCVLTHELGHSESVAMTAPPDASGKKNPIQQIKSTKTYLEIATYESVTGLAASDHGDDDGNGAGRCGKLVSDEKEIFDALVITRDALGVYLFAEALGQDTYTDIYNSYPDGLRTAVKKTIDELHSLGVDTLINIETGLENNDSFLVLENIEGMSNNTKRLLKARIGDEKIGEIAKMKKDAA